jgi:signal transduction histidine kinase/ActR/RegA family two-component response regulator
MLTAEGKVRAMNHAGAGILYERRSHIIGRPFAVFINVPDRPSFAELLTTVLQSDQKGMRELDLYSRAEERTKVRLTARSLAAAEPTVLLAFEDITTEKRAAERLLQADAALREANRRKDEFLAVLSHELRTPLSTLLMYGQLLRQSDLEPSKIRIAAEAIERAARAQARLIDDLLDVSRIVTGKLSMRVASVNVIDIAQAALTSMLKGAERRGVELIPNFESNIPSLAGDPERLRQAISNLLTNAIKFTSAGGQVRIRVACVKDRVVIDVEDTGNGIEPDFLPHIFERFSQADTSTTRTAGGLGLGLSIARSIVEAHQGTIRARSAGKGRGSTFTISLPLGATPRVAALRPSWLPTPPSNSRIRGTRLLIVEDDSGTRETLTEVLTLAGAEVRSASGAEAAMQMLGKFSPDVLVCDIAMADEDGCALLRRIRARGAKKGGTVPALALTAFAGEEDRKRTQAAGFDTHLVKPVDVDQLVSAICLLVPTPHGTSSASN